MVENSFNKVCRSAKRFARMRSSSAMTMTLSKNASTGSLAVESKQQGILIFALLPVRLDFGSVSLDECCQAFFFVCRIGQSAKFCGWLDAGFLRLLQDVAHAFAGRRDGLELGQMQNALHRLRPCDCIDHIIGVRREHRVHHVVAETEGVAQIKLQTFTQEVFYGAAVIHGGRKLCLCGRAAIGFASVFEQLAETDG